MDLAADWRALLVLLLAVSAPAWPTGWFDGKVRRHLPALRRVIVFWSHRGRYGNDAPWQDAV